MLVRLPCDALAGISIVPSVPMHLAVGYLGTGISVPARDWSGRAGRVRHRRDCRVCGVSARLCARADRRFRPLPLGQAELISLLGFATSAIRATD